MCVVAGGGYGTPGGKGKSGSNFWLQLESGLTGLPSPMWKTKYEPFGWRAIMALCVHGGVTGTIS